MSDDTSWWEPEVLDRGRWFPLVRPVLERARLAVSRDRFPHAVLLLGPENLGRELAAVELAAMLVCPQDGVEGCPCAACGRVRKGGHPDVSALFPRHDSSTGRLKKFIDIDQVREVVESAPSRPYEGRCRVWIISSAEAGGIGNEAANAFLKVLEEPPPHVRFILLAANPDLVLPTIRSRCQSLFLPGAVAQAARTGDGGVPAELHGSGLSPEVMSAVFAVADATLRSGVRGDLLPLLSLAARLEQAITADGVKKLEASERRDRMARAFDVVAAAAVELAAGAGDGVAEATARLASQLLTTGRRIPELNLDPERQLVSCLLAWHRDIAAA